MVKQVALLPAGCQPWNRGVCAASNDHFAYCATLAIYIYKVWYMSGYQSQFFQLPRQKLLDDCCCQSVMFFCCCFCWERGSKYICSSWTVVPVFYQTSKPVIKMLKCTAGTGHEITQVLQSELLDAYIRVESVVNSVMNDHPSFKTTLWIPIPIIFFFLPLE